MMYLAQCTRPDIAFSVNLLVDLAPNQLENTRMVQIYFWLSSKNN